ncbi:MAG: hypothetical protein JNN11_03770 [Candidatus Doudnabacteria bacterium]|nr:hypothetical protein [Candidatus Doudnabacteria bacterium]
MFRLLVLFLALVASTQAATSYVVTAASCADGTASLSLQQNYPLIVLSGGGEVLFESDCKISVGLWNTIPSEVVVRFRPKNGGMVRLSCNGCSTIFTMGFPGMFSYGVQFEDIIFDLTTSNSNTANAVVLDNMIRAKLRNVIFANRNTTRYRTDGLVLKNTYWSPAGLCTVEGGSAPCYTGDIDLHEVVWTGVFTYGLVTVPSNPSSNSNFVRVNVWGGYINLSGSGYGAYVMGSTYFTFRSLRVTNGSRGLSLRGLDHVVDGVQTSGNGAGGVVAEDTAGPNGETPAYNTTISNGSSPDGVTPCKDCSIINTRTATGVLTKLSSVRMVTAADPQSNCTTAAVAGSTCTYVVNFLTPFLPGVANYSLSGCGVQEFAGYAAPSVSFSNKTYTGFTVKFTAQTNAASTGKVECEAKLYGNQ